MLSTKQHAYLSQGTGGALSDIGTSSSPVSISPDVLCAAAAVGTTAISIVLPKCCAVAASIPKMAVRARECQLITGRSCENVHAPSHSLAHITARNVAMEHATTFLVAEIK